MRSEHPSDHDDPEQETSGAKEPLGPTLPLYDATETGASDRDDEPDPSLIDDDFDDDDEDEDDDDDDDFDDEDDDDDDEHQDELLPQVIEGEPRTVLITGACGNIGASFAPRGRMFTSWS